MTWLPFWWEKRARKVPPVGLVYLMGVAVVGLAVVPTVRSFRRLRREIKALNRAYDEPAD